MATYEVFVPVQGEIIYRVEANNADDAENIVSTMDWSDGELNIDYDGEGGTHVQMIAGCGPCGRVMDDDDAENSRCPFCNAVLVQEDCPNYGFGAEHAPVVTIHTETGKPYAMRHYRL